MTTYTTFAKKVKGNIWHVTRAIGQFNYVSVTKKTNNPFGTFGKEFSSIDKAQEAYKCADLKLFLLEIEMGLIDSIN